MQDVQLRREDALKMWSIIAIHANCLTRACTNKRDDNDWRTSSNTPVYNLYLVGLFINVHAELLNLLTESIRETLLNKHANTYTIIRRSTPMTRSMQIHANAAWMKTLDTLPKRSPDTMKRQTCSPTYRQPIFAFTFLFNCAA